MTNIVDYLTLLTPAGSEGVLIGTRITTNGIIKAVDMSCSQICDYEIGKYDARPGSHLFVPIVQLTTPANIPTLPRWVTPDGFDIEQDGDGINTAFYVKARNLGILDTVFVTIYWVNA